MREFYIAVTQRDWEAARTSLLTPDNKENAGVFFCGKSDYETEYRLLVQDFKAVSSNLYDVRERNRLQVSPRFYNEVISECIRRRAVPVIVHSHPSHSAAWYSASDDFGEARLLPVLESLIPGSTPASLVITPTSVIGRRHITGEFTWLNGLKIVGLRSKVFRFLPQESTYTPSPNFQRQVLAFGPEGQATIEQLKVGVVGVGGIGSLVCEQLARLGVRDLTLVDEDTIESSNLSRLFGATPSDVGKRKTDTVGAYVKKLGVARLRVISQSAIEQGVLMQLRDRDILFSCVDNDRTRAILNRFSHQYLVTTIDLGTRIDGREGHIRGAAGRATIIGSGMVCARCSHHINAERIYAESLSNNERKQLRREGYVMGIDEPAPAVISINTVVAGLGVTAAINLFVELTGGVQPVDQLYDATSGTVFAASPKHEHDCDVCGELKGLKALGDSQIVSSY
jgi:molybdopterin/thiamine biosynthesis adenylyltransferase